MAAVDPNEKKIEALRAAWNKAVEKDKPKDALLALQGLEPLEPREPRWPHRLGDVLRRLGRLPEAESAYGRAMDIYNQAGFIARAVAVAKIIVQLNPARASVLDTLDQDAALSLRRAGRPLESPNVSPVRPAPAAAAASPIPSPPDSGPPSYVAGIPAAQVRAVASAMHLAPAVDSANDEVRFADVPNDLSIDIELSDLETQEEAAHAGDPVGVDKEPSAEPTAERLCLMTATTLFAAVPREALAELARSSDLVELGDAEVVFRRGEVADALFVIVEGVAHVRVMGLPGGGISLTEGQVVGEGCLLEDGIRQCDVQSSGRLVALRIPKHALARIVAAHPAVGDVLFDLLLQRLIANTVQTSPLFAAFDPEARRELARLFEVRRAVRGVLLTEFGKRSDGLYLALAGGLEIQDSAGTRTMALGTMFGQESMLSQAPARRTVRVVREAVLLRLPAARFGTFAMQYPPALAHLSELASQGTDE